MVATKGQAIALAVISILTIGSGIAVIVLFKFTLDAILNDNSNSAPVVAAFWPYGLPVLVTGVMGLVAAGFRNNVAVGLFMAAGIICLIIEGAFAVIAGLVLFFLQPVDLSSCYMVNDICTCGSYPPVGSQGCEGADILGLSRAACALIIIAWLLMLAGTIASCAACCCGKRDLGQPGVIMTPGYQMQQPAGGYGQHQYAPAETKGQQY